MNNIWVIIKKELKKYFTDKRILMGLFLPGILIYIMYSLMGNTISSLTETYNEFTISIVNEPNEFSSFWSNSEWKITFVDINKEEYEEKLVSKEIDLYIVYEEDFYNKMINYTSSSTEAPQVEIYYNSVNDSSSYIYSIYVSFLDTFEDQISNKFDINSNQDILYDVASEEDTSIKVISMLMPFLLITFLVTGCTSVCSESVAGEKERGTIATLLITPTKREHIVIGKIISLAITSLVSALTSFAGLLLSLPNLAAGSISLNAYDVMTVLPILGIIVVTVLLITMILTIFSTYAKSVKEATAYSGIVMIVAMFIGASNFMTSGSVSNNFLYIIPIFNSIQCLIEVFNVQINIVHYLITVISNFVYIAIGIFLLTKMFNSERIMFNR